MNFQWSPNDPATLRHAERFASKVGKALFEGVWATVQLQPDLFSPQRLIIGVLVGTNDRPHGYRMLQSLEKIECLYGRKVASRLHDHLKSAEFTLARALKEKIPLRHVAFDSDNLELSAPWPTSGQSDEAILSRLYADVVHLEPEGSDEPKFLSLDTEQVRRLVNAELKRIAGLAFEQMVVDPNATLIHDDEGMPHKLDFNLRVEGGAGSVVSAVYKTPNYVELGLLRADRDLRTYAGIRKLDNLAVFVMTPREEQFDPGEFAKMTELLDETAWRMERAGVRIEMHDDPTPLALGIMDWAGVAPIAPAP
jgi:hypothetical protein